MKQRIFWTTLCVLLALFSLAASGEERAGTKETTGEAQVAGSDSAARPEGAAARSESASEGELVAACVPLGTGPEGVAGFGQEGAERNWDPATCGSCGSFCSSDNACFGRLLGDRCNNTGATCQAFTGCALFNCCRCV